MSRGAIYVVYGEPAREEATMSIRTLWENMPNLPVAVVSDREVVDGAIHIHREEEDRGGRLAKLHLDLLSPWDQTLYIDADTRIRRPMWAGFEILDDGWDLVIAYSQHQGSKRLWHIGEEDREATYQAVGVEDVLQLQAGVMFFSRCQQIHNLFDRWVTEWRRFEDQDQGALLRALQGMPARVWVLGRPWNNGPLIAHHFGRAKRRGRG